MNQIAWILSSVVNIQLKIQTKSSTIRKRQAGNRGRTPAAGGTGVGVNGAGNTWVDEGATGSRWLRGGDDAGNQL
jgi:hypothetical protein